MTKTYTIAMGAVIIGESASPKTSAILRGLIGNRCYTQYAGGQHEEVVDDGFMLGYLLETAQRLKRAGVPALFYLTPIDVEGGRQLVGEALPANVAANSRVIMDALARSGASCLDLTTLLPEDRFVDREYACEHLDLAGRRRVAEALAGAVKSLAAAATRPVPTGAAAN